MQGNVVFVLAIGAFLLLLWVAAGTATPGGAPSRLGSLNGAATASSSVREGSSERSERAAARELARIQDEVVDLQRSAVFAARFGTPSPYKDLVSLSLGTVASAKKPNEERVTITVSSRAEEPITLSGWRLTSGASGSSVSIAYGTPLPRTSRAGDVEPIRLFPGDQAIVTMGESPVGMSFRENRCTGYFEQFQDFVPALSNQCPSPIEEFDRFYFGSERTLDACRAYLKGVNRCEIPRDEPSSLGRECQAFIDTHLVYAGCVDAHLGDREFFSDTWRIYLEEDREVFSRDHDTVKLLDAEGKTVDLVSY